MSIERNHSGLKEFAESYGRMDKESRRRRIRAQEREIDGMLRSGVMTQETAWDCYFGLLHECDLGDFLEDYERLLAKIDVKRYDPFASPDPLVRELARIRWDETASH